MTTASEPAGRGGGEHACVRPRPAVSPEAPLQAGECPGQRQGPLQLGRMRLHGSLGSDRWVVPVLTDMCYVRGTHLEAHSQHWATYFIFEIKK